MFSTLSATDVAFAMVGIMQMVAACVWALGAWLVPATRRAAAHWAGYAALSACSFLLLVAALRSSDLPQAEALRAIGNLGAILGTILLQRGIWIFIGRDTPFRLHATLGALALGVAYLGLTPSAGGLRVGVNSAIVAFLYLSMAWNVVRHMRRTQAIGWSLLMGTPLVLGALGHGMRGLRAALFPGSVTAEMAADSALNVGSSMLYMVLAMAFHATLMALVLTRLVSELRRRSRHDSLTGLLNRRAMEEALAEQIQTSRISGEPFTVLMLDLDHFKSINDGFGHAVGDLALKHAATSLRRAMRAADRLARFGGEEFLVLLPSTRLSDGLELGERVRGDLAGAPLLHAGIKIPLSASIGVAEWAGRPEDITRLLVRADLALYRAKQQGRDRVVTASNDEGAPSHAPLMRAEPR